ncbi:MAG: hypothetical protein WD070_03905 [Pirellulaceae bacterium]
MHRNQFLPILLSAAMVAQAVIAGWGHTHAHVGGDAHGNVGAAGYLHHDHTVGEPAHQSHEHSPLPHHPADEEDCSVCRHLALAAILTLDLEASAIGDATEALRAGKSLPVSTIAVGLRRPRSPPELI